jgi:hypothetical protein
VQLVLKVLPPSLSKKRGLWVVPPSQALQGGNENKLTTHELFQMEHKEQLKLAQDWVEKTSQSCSTVAILVAAGVYAAAYSIPGGSHDPGTPIFLHNRFFLAFTALELIAIVSSLTSAVMFLSILTTPCSVANFSCNHMIHKRKKKHHPFRGAFTQSINKLKNLSYSFNKIITI